MVANLLEATNFALSDLPSTIALGAFFIGSLRLILQNADYKFLRLRTFRSSWGRDGAGNKIMPTLVNDHEVYVPHFGSSIVVVGKDDGETCDFMVSDWRPRKVRGIMTKQNAEITHQGDSLARFDDLHTKAKFSHDCADIDAEFEVYPLQNVK